MKHTLKLSIAMLLIALGTVVISCKSSGSKEETKTESHPEQEAIIVYTCPMHPEIEKHEPGDCPECGMELVEKKAEMEHSHGSHVH